MTAYLVRHAKAGSREKWTSADSARPLTAPGLRQAEGLVGVLSGAEIRGIRSSPSVRCVQTVAPLAAARRLDVIHDPQLEEGSDPVITLDALAVGEGLVLCTHGDIIAAVVLTLADRRVPLGGGPQWAKGSIWAFEASGGRIVSGRYLPPPDQ